jgi:amidohydrolase
MLLGDTLEKILPKLVEIRHVIHQNPELKYEEYQTAALVEKTLREFGITDIQTGVGKTGVVAMLDSGKPGKVVGLRADMDALPVTEQTTVTYHSKIPGKMHACGHDGHTASLLGCAYVLQQMKAQFTGKIKLIFQPAEEGGAGAAAMIKDGVLENPKVDAIFGYHNWPTVKTGIVGLRSGCIFAAADEFSIIIHGKGGHASQPHLTQDPVYIGASMITQLQSIVSRLTSPTDPVVVSITQFTAGNTFNVVPSEAHLRGTIRTVDPTTRWRVQQQFQNIVVSIAKMYGASASVELLAGYPPTINHQSAVDLVRTTALQLFGSQMCQEIEMPKMAAEDFSFFLEAIPGCYFLIGNGEDCPTCHHPQFNFNDDILRTAILTLSQTAINFLNG